MPRDYQNEESSIFCKTHKVEHWGPCPKCLPQCGGELVETLEDIGAGLSTESWDNYLEQQTQDAMNQLDQDKGYIDGHV